MAPTTPRLRILSVGGNAVSAFLSWRLQATNACDVSLVWKSGFETVSQYGISFKSRLFGNERFKPHAVVRTPEEASQTSRAPFDYVLLCVKALPDVYDLASIVESVVAPQHTCILINTTHSLGIETYLEQRFPTNVVLSLVSGVEITQLGSSEFEHMGATDIWVGPANKNPQIPQSIQSDMAEALAMTLSSGQVDCKVSENIRQQQYERMIGPIAFHPISVLFETPNHAELLEKTGAQALIHGLVDELLNLARSQGCQFSQNFRDETIREMIKPTETQSIMYQDFAARRPMEVETYLGSPLKLAQEARVAVPRVETLYALLHNANIVNQTRTAEAGPMSPAVMPPPRMSSAPYGRNPPNGGPMKNGLPPGRGSRAPSMQGPPPGVRRGPPPNGFPPRGPPNGYPPNGQMVRRPSFEANDLEEFSHLMLYDDAAEGGFNDNSSGVYGNGIAAGSSNDLALRERELMLRQKELALREQEMHLRQRGRGPPPPRRVNGSGGFEDDDEDDDFFDPMESRPGQPPVDDNFDMMSVTSRRNRRGPPRPSMDHPGAGMPPPPRSSRGNPFTRNKNRTSAGVMSSSIGGLHDSLMNNALLGYSSNRYGDVDRAQRGQDSRTSSLTTARLDEFQRNGGTFGSNGGFPPMARRASQSPGNALSPGPRPPGQRPSPPNGYPSMNGANGMNGHRPSPPGGVRQPIPRHPPGHGNAVAPHQVEQQAGVSNLYPPKKSPQVRSLTGSASASAGSGDSGASAHLDSEPSAHSSSSSLGPRLPLGVR